MQAHSQNRFRAYVGDEESTPLMRDELKGIELDIFEAVLERGVWAAATETRPRVSAAFLARLVCARQLSADEGPRSIELARLVVVGDLDLSATHLRLPLKLMDCAFADVKLAEASTQSLRLMGCELATLDLGGAHVCGTLWVTGSKLSGALVLKQATIERNVNVNGTSIVGRNGRAIDGDQLVVKGGVFLRDGFRTSGGVVRLRGAKIGGQFGCEGAQLVGCASALDLDSASIGGSVFLRARPATDGRPSDPFSALGEIRLSGARVGGAVECAGMFSAPIALRANGLSTEVDLLLGEGFNARGEVRISGARIGRNLTCIAAALHNPGKIALDLSRTTVGGRLEYAPEVVEGAVSLHNASVGSLEDDVGRWPQQRDLEGFVYDNIGVAQGAPNARLSDRLKWLEGPYRPQPYEQLIAVYRRSGQEKEARAVGVQKQRRRRASLPRWRQPWSYLLDALFGFGYYPARALAWLAVLLAAGTLVFTSLHHSGELAARAGSAPRPAFNAPLYTLDLLLPVVSLKQREAWVAVSHLAQIATAAYIILGWIIATAVVAVLAGLVKRD